MLVSKATAPWIAIEGHQLTEVDFNQVLEIYVEQNSYH